MKIEAGDGFSDIMFKYNNPITGEVTGVILELKRASCDDAQTLTDKYEEAIKQCKDRKYFSIYLRRSDIKHIYIYRLAFGN